MSRRSRRHRADQRAAMLRALTTANEALQRAQCACADATNQIRRLALERNNLQADLVATKQAAAADSAFKSRFIGVVTKMSIAHGIPTTLDLRHLKVRDHIPLIKESSQKRDGGPYRGRPF